MSRIDDLAFSLPAALLPDSHNHERQRPVVGVGLMTYYDRRSTSEHGETIYREYLEKLADFVTRLLEHNPFASKAPRYIRARLFKYEFTTEEEHRTTGAWWKRREIGEYLPEVSLP